MGRRWGTIGSDAGRGKYVDVVRVADDKGGRLGWKKDAKRQQPSFHDRGGSGTGDD